MKEVINLIKKLLENKRTRALAILIIYIIFFVIVFVLINSSSSTLPIISVDPLEEMKDKTISQVEFIGNHNFIVSDNMIIYNEAIYNINEMPTELSIYDISIYTTNNIYDLVKSATLESTNYVENSDTYLIDATEFERIIYDNQIDSNSKIRITINKEKINSVYIDLKEYYGYEIKIDLRS